MQEFLKEIVEWNKFELVIDTNIFNRDIVLKSAYTFLDRWYFFFKLDTNKNIILQFTRKEENKENPKDIIWSFSDELLETLLRNNLEKNNKIIREKIVWVAITWSLDFSNYVNIDTDNKQFENEINFDKDIDDILKEIENDPDLKIDENEIEKILKEIEDEAMNSNKTDNIIKIDINAVKKVKDNFKK